MKKQKKKIDGAAKDFIGSVWHILVFSNGLNCFIVLISLYIGSSVGIGQIMHTVLVEYAHTEVNIYIKTKSVKIRHFILEQMGRGSTYREAKNRLYLFGYLCYLHHHF